MSKSVRILSLITIASTLGACGARGEMQFADRVVTLAREIQPSVERAVGLAFKYPPAVAVRSKDEVQEFLMAKMATDFPREELERISLAYSLFGLIPADLDLESLLVQLYTEQVVGYYDPESDSLYVVEGADPVQLRLIVAHELVHALQAQYVPLDSILDSRGDNDRRVAAQAVFEGQGMMSSLVALMPEQDFSAMPEFWRQYRQSVREAQESMPIFRSAPLILREGLIFPYLGGADFIRWYASEYPGTVPFGERMPTSTEQILHAEKYREREAPVDLRYPSDDRIVYEDGFGEFETRVLITELSGNESTGAATARDWAGDRYAVFAAGDDHAVVWWTAWDTPQASKRFARVLEREWTHHRRDGREFLVEVREIGSHPGVVFVDAPRGWAGLQRPPRPRVVPPEWTR